MNPIQLPYCLALIIAMNVATTLHAYTPASAESTVHEPDPAVADMIMPRFEKSQWLFRTYYIEGGRTESGGTVFEEVINTKSQ